MYTYCGASATDIRFRGPLAIMPPTYTRNVATDKHHKSHSGKPSNSWWFILTCSLSALKHIIHISMNHSPVIQRGSFASLSRIMISMMLKVLLRTHDIYSLCSHRIRPETNQHIHRFNAYYELDYQSTTHITWHDIRHKEIQRIPPRLELSPSLTLTNQYT